MKLPLKNPRPDREGFKRVLLGESSARVPFVELIIDEEILRTVAEDYLGLEWLTLPKGRVDRELLTKRLENVIECWYRLGYDYVRLTPFADAAIPFPGKRRRAADTANLSKGERSWTEEGEGMVSDWEDFENYPWPSTDDLDYWLFERAIELLPSGMGLLVCPSSGFFEIPLNSILGYENLARLIYRDPDLVAAIFERVGRTIYEWYQGIVDLDEKLIGFFQGDDMGFKQGTLVSPDFLREHVLPWHKKLADLAHENGLAYVLHSCGNIEEIMDDLIDEVGIDAKHSFEDEIISVTEFSEKYAGRVTPLGGIDMDKLTRLEPAELRVYVRKRLEGCLEHGSYALGSGNSVANYVPVDNYLTMLDEGLSWNRVHPG